MKPEIQEARTKLTEAQSNVEFYKIQVDRFERNCPHEWTEVKYEPVEHRAYIIPGDKPGDLGYGGVDRRFDTSVPASTEDRWTRDCKICGKHDETKKSNVEKLEKKTPAF